LRIERHGSVEVIPEQPLSRRSILIQGIGPVVSARIHKDRIEVDALRETPVLAHVALVVDDGFASEDRRPALWVGRNRCIEINFFGGAETMRGVARLRAGAKRHDGWWSNEKTKGDGEPSHC